MPAAIASALAPVTQLEGYARFGPGCAVPDRELQSQQGSETESLAVPEDFMFQLTAEEWEVLRFQTGRSNTDGDDAGGSGVAMLSSVLSSEILARKI